VPISPRRVMTFKASNVLKQRVLKSHLSRKAKKKPVSPEA
jgi:integration host factor subunit alpha